MADPSARRSSREAGLRWPARPRGLPWRLLKGLVRLLFRLLYRVELHGAENIPRSGPGAVIAPNHVSFLDGPLIAAFFPIEPVYAIEGFYLTHWLSRLFVSLVDAVPMTAANPMAAKALIHELRGGRNCVIFPEGRLTVTGGLMQIREGAAVIADAAGALVVPVRIDGAELTPFSRLHGKLRLRWFPKITLTALPPRRLEADPAMRGRERHQALALQLYDVMTEMMLATSPIDRTVLESLIAARRRHGGGKPVINDIDRAPEAPMSYSRLLSAAFAVGRRLRLVIDTGAPIGLLLPNAGATAIAFYAVHAIGKVPAMLNFASGAANMLAACRAAEIDTVLTSRRFIVRARLEAAITALAGQVRIVYLEDLAEGMGLVDRLYGLLAWRWPLWRAGGEAASAPAVVLFTSGTEGAPKGVVLSHRNLNANCQQMAAVTDFNPSDCLLGVMPLFHALGLTTGLLLPLLQGVNIVLYPSPLSYRMVPIVAYNTNATIVLATDTFLAGYGRSAHPFDFYSVRYVFSGAEAVRPETRSLWFDKFGLRILEGYGTTETSPCIALNTPMQGRTGTVGRLLPGIRYRLEPIAGLARGGRLWVQGSNVMLGYLRAEAPGRLQPPEEGWHDTGDIAEVDDQRFVTILGRVKRFAKVGGEMVSLAAIEALAAAEWPDAQHAVIAKADPRKGERLILVTTCREAEPSALRDRARRAGLTELAVPKRIVTLEPLPLLATGKPDYVAIAARIAAGENGAA